MSATEPAVAATSGNRSYDEIRKAWHAANLSPLWENAAAHHARDGGPAPQHWKWKQIRPLVDDAVKVATPAAVERRVLTLINPNEDNGIGGTATTLRRLRQAYSAAIAGCPGAP
jgi:gentisate 1,2-dioxygenase